MKLPHKIIVCERNDSESVFAGGWLDSENVDFAPSGFTEYVRSDLYEEANESDRESVAMYLTARDRADALRAERDDLLSENAKMKNALHAAVNRPMGVVPDEAAEFFESNYLGKASEKS